MTDSATYSLKVTEQQAEEDRKRKEKTRIAISGQGEFLYIGLHMPRPTAGRMASALNTNTHIRSVTTLQLPVYFMAGFISAVWCKKIYT